MSQPRRPPAGAPAAPAGAIVLVGTPIGNLADLSPRARDELDRADLILCEDTRRTRALLAASNISSAAPRSSDRPGSRLVSFHRDNERSRVQEVLAAVAEGRRVAVVSDAGMPGISDPGQHLVAAAAAAGVTVSVVPGPSAVLAALVLSGLPTDRFCVEGFLPRRGTDRAHRLAALAGEDRTVVLLESPRRLPATLADLLASGPDRGVAVARELTKVHEELWRGSLSEAVAVFSARPVQGEVVLVLAPAPPKAPPDPAAIAADVRERVAAGASPRQVADAVAARFGIARRLAYQMAVAARDDLSG